MAYDANGMWVNSPDDRTHKYDDIIDLPHPEPWTHPRMSMRDRAAQFAPFAALKQGGAIEEELRRTERRFEVDELTQTEINSALNWINDHIAEHPAISVTHFVPDERKEGGSYQIRSGNVGRIDAVAGQLIFTDRSTIPLSNIYHIQISTVQLDADPANDCN